MGFVVKGTQNVCCSAFRGEREVERGCGSDWKGL